MGVKFKPLSRRTFLRGAGVALGLPLLEAMLPARAGRGRPEAAAAPVRAAYLYFPNGAWMDAWVPKQTGTDYELPFSLTPLEPVQGLGRRAERAGQAVQPQRRRPLRQDRELPHRPARPQDDRAGPERRRRVGRSGRRRPRRPPDPAAVAGAGDRPGHQRPGPGRQLHPDVRVVHRLAAARPAAAAADRPAGGLRADVRRPRRGGPAPAAAVPGRRPGACSTRPSTTPATCAASSAGATSRSSKSTWTPSAAWSGSWATPRPAEPGGGRRPSPTA